MLSRDLGYSIISHYQPNAANRISELCDKYEYDKGSNQASGHLYSWSPHTCADYYDRLFEYFRQSISSVFECGLGTNDPAISCRSDESRICFIENSIEHLPQHGIYVIEDVDVIDRPQFKKYLDEKPYLVDYPALA